MQRRALASSQRARTDNLCDPPSESSADQLPGIATAEARSQFPGILRHPTAESVESPLCPDGGEKGTVWRIVSGARAKRGGSEAAAMGGYREAPACPAVSAS